MHQAMVKETEKNHIGEIVRPASRPGNDVMRIRPVDLAIAAREAATFISDSQRPPHRRRDSSRRPPDLDHHRAGQEYPRHRAAAREPLRPVSRGGERELY